MTCMALDAAPATMSPSGLSARRADAANRSTVPRAGRRRDRAASCGVRVCLCWDVEAVRRLRLPRRHDRVLRRDTALDRRDHRAASGAMVSTNHMSGVQSPLRPTGINQRGRQVWIRVLDRHGPDEAQHVRRRSSDRLGMGWWSCCRSGMASASALIMSAVLMGRQHLAGAGC